jgi:hypothetical protein
MTKKIADTFEEQVGLIDPQKPLKCYRNLNRRLGDEKDFWSVKQDGIVRFHCRCIFLKDVVFLVNEKVRQRVVQNKRKEVHAYVQGFICDISFTDGYEVTYNPYKCQRFVTGDRSAISADRACLVKRNGMKVFASNILTEQTSSVTIETVQVHML